MLNAGARSGSACMQALARYNALFRHLLRLRRVAGELDEAWTRLGRRSSARGGRQRAQHALWLLRARAASLVTNLLVYMQARGPTAAYTASSSCTAGPYNPMTEAVPGDV